MINHQCKNKDVVLRQLVLRVVNDSPVKLTGREIAKRAGLQYKQTIDALDALHNHGKVKRVGKKFNTRWMRNEDEKGINPADLLNRAFFRITRKRVLREKFREFEQKIIELQDEK